MLYWGRFLLQKWKQNPQRDWGAEVVKDLLLFGPKVGQKKWLNFGEDLFFLEDHLISAWKTVTILVKIFFFEITWFWRKNRLNRIQDWWTFGSSSFTVVFTSQKSPPLSEILAARLVPKLAEQRRDHYCRCIEYALCVLKGSNASNSSNAS